MQEYSIVNEIQVDPYGHKKLVSAVEHLPGDSLFVARALVSYELTGVKESYWIHHKGDLEKNFYLWIQLDEGDSRYRCCARYKSKDEIELAVLVKNMLYALWRKRSPIATALNSFDKEGVLTQKWLNEFTKSYHKRIERPKVFKNDKREWGEIYYDDGSLRYRGDHRKGLAHGKGVGFWEKGNVWCDGFFENNKPHGKCKVYFPDGTLRHEGLFDEGLPYGPGKEFFNNGQLWFAGIFGRQSTRYYYGARIWIQGKLYDRNGMLIHDGKFESGGSHSQPDRST